MLGLTLQSQLQRFGKGSRGKEDVGKQTGNEKPKGGSFQEVEKVSRAAFKRTHGSQFHTCVPCTAVSITVFLP